MKLNNKQIRQYKLAIMLFDHNDVKADEIMSKLDCSTPSFTRALRSLQDDYNAEVCYKKSKHSYCLVKNGDLTSEKIKQIQEVLNENQLSDTEDNNVSIKRPIKKSVSISISFNLYKKLNSLTKETKLNRSEIIEALIDQFATSDHIQPKNQNTQTVNQ